MHFSKVPGSALKREIAREFPGTENEYGRLLETFVPYAVGRGDGFAGFRSNAATTNSPLDRLRALQIPRLSDVRDGLDRYIESRNRTRELERRIEACQRTIDERVWKLYELTEDERERVRREFPAGRVVDQ